MLRDKDTTNPAGKFPVKFNVELVCPYCKVDYSKVVRGDMFLRQHIRRYHKASIDKVVYLDS